MRIAFFVNSIEGEHPRYTTTALALAALTRGHDICYLTPGDFVLRPDDSLLVRARTLPGTAYKKVETLYQALQGDEAVIETIDVREIDVLMLRSDPSQDAAERPWAANAGPMFGRLAVARGVLVLNDPDGLALAQNKLYLQGFPRGGAAGQPDLEEHRRDPRLHRRAAGRRDPEAAARARAARTCSRSAPAATPT